MTATLAAGTRLGPYQIVAPVGAGGMGEVYRARDTRLERDVAVKILPAALAADAQFRARFEREAKAISSLSHPHVCALHDVGQASVDGAEVHYLVLELIEGESLADRLLKGPLPVEQALRLGIQIAAALDAAHRRGIVHRDLKPDNVMLTRSGIKLLDFGLAKAGGSGEALAGGGSALATEQKPLTEHGAVMGTFQYMAPEQLEGQEADGRTDLFALGAVLYEMATGRRAFEGKSRTSLIAAIVSSQPSPVSSLLPMSPPALDHVVSKCLEKEPDDRWQSARDVMSELQWIGQGGSGAGLPAPLALRRRVSLRIAWVVAAALLLTTLAVGWVAFERGRALGVRPRIHASIPAPEGARLEYSGSNVGALTVSPDGTRLTFVARGPDGKRLLFVRPLDSGAAQALSGTEGAIFPFWSPDGRQIGFFADGKLKRIDASGGATVTIADASDGRGGTWNREGVIVFAPETQAGLYRVSAAGGSPVPLTKLDAARHETTHRFPFFLPDGRHLLFIRASHSVAAKDEANAIWIGSLDPEQPRRLMQSGSNAVFAQGHLLFVRDGHLMAQPFDDRKLRLRGEAFTAADMVQYLPNFFRGAFATSETGLLAYLPGHSLNLQLVWTDRQGKELGRVGEPGEYAAIRLSPDEKKLAVTLSDPASGTSDIWVHDLAREVRSRLTFHELNDSEPVWSPDGRQIVFSSTRTGNGDLYVRPASGGAKEVLLCGSEHVESPQDWSPDGAHILLNRGTGKNDLWVLPLSGDRKPFPLVQTPADEGWGRFSPDGKWVAYLSNESGRFEMYATRFPGGEGKWQLSTRGADWLVGWKKDGSEIYHMGLDGRLLATRVTLGDDLVAEPAQELFPTQSNLAWANSRNGDRFVIGSPEVPTTNVPITLVLNWLSSR